MKMACRDVFHALVLLLCIVGTDGLHSGLPASCFKKSFTALFITRDGPVPVQTIHLHTA